jgi:putative oxidoreductase
MRWFIPPYITGPGAVGLLLGRLVVGLAFIFHGWPKVQNATEWMGPEAGVPGFLQAAAAVSEFGGGIALILGLLTPLASLGIAGTMVGALAMAHLPQGHAFVASKPGEPSFELAAVYLAVALLFLLVGPGSLSADRCLFGRFVQPKQRGGVP